MNIQSMTGYGQGETSSFRVESRSVNHKHIDIQLSMPPFLFAFDPDIRKEVRNRFSRGRIEVYISMQQGKKSTTSLNVQLAKEYFKVLSSLKDELFLEDPITLNMVASQREIFTKEAPEIETSELFVALKSALTDLERSRCREAESLVQDIEVRVEALSSHLNRIKEKRHEFIAVAQGRLHERLKELLGDVPIDDTRLIQETAVLVERSDITEETVRAESHLGSFSGLIQEGGTIGKKADFLIQELRREVNTIGAKASDVDIVHLVVDMKNELEKIREQVQNIQ